MKKQVSPFCMLLLFVAILVGGLFSAPVRAINRQSSTVRKGKFYIGDDKINAADTMVFQLMDLSLYNSVYGLTATDSSYPTYAAMDIVDTGTSYHRIDEEDIFDVARRFGGL